MTELIVNIATRLLAGQPRNCGSISVRDKIGFCSKIETGSGAHPASYSMGCFPPGWSEQGVKITTPTYS
jgi:hypothetical protein